MEQKQLKAIKPFGMVLSVSELLKFPYLKRSLEMKRRIVSAGRQALLKHIPMWEKAKLAGKSEKCTDGYYCNPALFERVLWLVRCNKKQKFYCYNCLLYSPFHAMLRSNNRALFCAVLDAARHHESTMEHVIATVKLHMFMKDNFSKSVLPVPNKTQHNCFVKMNREILKRLTDAVYCAVRHKHSQGDGRYIHTRVEVDDCVKFLELLRKVDVSNSDLIDGAADVLKRYPRIVNDLVDAITRVVKTAIKNETQQSTYVSVILSEHGMPQHGKSQISSVLRYIKRGKVCERFIGFTNLIGFNSSNSIYKIVLDVIQQYGIAERFLALSLDGKVLPTEELPGFIAAVKIDHQYAYFVPWHSHGFGNTLLQSLSESDDCGLFLKQMQAMEKSLEHPKLRESLEITLLSKHTSLRAHKWYEKEPFIVFVASYRNDFIEFFDGILKNCKYWETDDIANILSFRGFLQEVDTVFLLQLFKKVFNKRYFDETSNFVPQRELERFVFGNPRIATFKKYVGYLHLEFQSVWDIVDAEIRGDSKLFTEKKDKWFADFDRMFHSVIRNLYKEIDIRCNYLSRLMFCDLLNCNSQGKIFLCPQMLSGLMTEHGPFFNKSVLQSEAAALNAQPAFEGKSVHELLECFADLNLRNVLPQLYKLAEFILTLPFLPASRDGGSSKLRDINKCSFIPQDTRLPSGEASFLCVESEMLDELKESPLFYEDVCARFYELNKYLLLVQV